MDKREAEEKKTQLLVEMAKLEKIIQAPEPTNGNLVTIGVKVSPETKLHIVNEASALGLTMSAYCETILANREKILAKMVIPKG